MTILTDEAVNGDIDDATASNMTEGAGDDDGGEEADPIELVIITESYYYLNYIIRTLALTHSIVAFSMLIAYYCLKVCPLYE